MSARAFNLAWQTLGNEGVLEASVTRRARAGRDAHAPLAFLSRPAGR